MIQIIIAYIILGISFSPHSKKTPFSDARYQWHFAANENLVVSGMVKTGVRLWGVERKASLARGGDGYVAEFNGGWLTISDTSLILFKDQPSFTLYLRVKSQNGPVQGTLMMQQGPHRLNSGSFDITGWYMPFIKRNHLGFHGMITGGLSPNAGSYIAAVNMNMPGEPVPAWHDIILTKEKNSPLRLYSDGILVSVRPGSSISPGSRFPFAGIASPLTFGAAPDGKNQFRGMIDHAAFWDRSLSKEEIANLTAAEVNDNLEVKIPSKWDEQSLQKIVGTGAFPSETPINDRFNWFDERIPGYLTELIQNDPHFPRYHLSIPGEVWNPIAFYHKGKHHLFLGWTSCGCFRYFDTSGEAIVWQHLVSEDLLTWTVMPMPMRAENQHENGTFFVNDQGEVVVFYYGAGSYQPRMAVSHDPDLLTWDVYPDKVKIYGLPEDLKARHDPSAVYKTGNTWFMTATTVRPGAKEAVLPLYRARNKELTEWDYAGTFFKSKDGRPINECGQVFRIDGKMVFTSIHELDKQGTYLTGELAADGSFKAENKGVPDYHSLNYNCVSTSVDETGRAVMWKWMNVVRSLFESSRAGWWNCYSIPREVGMDSTGKLLFKPASEIEKLRVKCEHKEIPELRGNEDEMFSDLSASQAEIRMSWIPGGGKNEAGILITDGEGRIEAWYDGKNQEMVLDFSRLSMKKISGNDQTMLSSSAVEVLRAPLKVNPGNSVHLRFFADRSFFEVYGNDEVCISKAAFFNHPDRLKAGIFNRSGGIKQVSADAWELNGLNWMSFKK